MDSKIFGVVIRVKNIETCKAFYRDVLNLGTPVMDSNFWVEFKINDSVSLCLEKIEWEEEVPRQTNRTAWILMVNKLEDFIERISAYGYSPLSKEEDCLGFTVHRFEDPEGNPFLVSNTTKPQSKK